MAITWKLLYAGVHKPSLNTLEHSTAETKSAASLQAVMRNLLD